MGLGMEEEKGPGLKDVQINCSLIPKTPAKPDLTSTTQQLYSDPKEKDMFYADFPRTERFKQVADEANSLGTGQVSMNLPQDSRTQFITNRCTFTNAANISWDFKTCQVGDTNNSHVQGDSFRINNDKFVRDDELNKVSFRDLLAMANAFGTPPTAEDEVKRMAFGASSSMFAINNGPQVDQSTIISKKSTYLQNQNILLDKVDSEWGSNQTIFKRVSSVLSSPFCQLRSPSRRTTDSVLDMNERAPFEPVTPEKGNAKQKLNSTVSESSKYDMCAKRKEQGSEIVRDEVMKIHEKDATISIQILENHEHGKEDSEDADISQSQQKKPRKKRHRPKVVVEGQPKKTPTPRAKKPISSAEGARVKRKYVRRKGVKDFSNTSSEVGTTETDANINTGSEGKIEFDANKGTPCSMGTPTGKRKYDRKKGTNKPETAALDEEIIDTTTRKTARYTRNSCRRSLNFDLENQEENFSAQENLGVNMHSRQEMEVMIEKNDAGTVCEVIHNTNPILNNDLLKPERQPSHHSQMDSSQTNHLCTDQSAATRGKCLIVFSDVTHDKEAKTLQPKVNPDCWLTPKSPYDSNWCNSTHLTPENGSQGYKREYLDTAMKDEVCITNVNGMFYNSLQAYSSIFTQNSDANDDICSMRLPEIYKKMKTGRRHDTATSNSQSTMIVFANHMKLEKQPLTDTCSNFLFTSEGKQEYSSTDQWIVSNPIKDIPATYSHLNEPENIGLSVLGPTAPSRNEKVFAVPHQPHTCSESYEIDVLSRKRMKQSKRKVHVDQVTYNHPGYHGSVAKLTGPRLAGKRNSMLTVDFVTELLNRLDLNASVIDQSSITAQHVKYEHALVPYQRAGAVIPFDQSFDKVRRRRPRPKVELDDETTRVWNLLLENIESEGIDGTDEEKSKWWREERRVFNGRADSFIARMHLVQGDRRFSPWKGSVLDSVVGVFLTQNVSDHLSSSAFMSLAAQFPIKSKKIPTELHEERVNTKIKEAEIYMINHNETCRLDNLLNPVCEEILEDFRCNDISLISSMKSSENSFGGISHEDSLRGHVASFSAHSSVISHTLLSGKKMIHLMKDKNDAEDAISSQTSEISSQSFVNSPIAQNTECTESYVPRSSVEEHRAGIIPHSFTKPTFVELLHMAETVQNSEFKKDRNIFDVDELAQSESLSIEFQNEVPLNDCTPPTDSDTDSIKCTSQLAPNLGSQSSKCFHLSQRMRNTSDIYCRQGFSPAESRVSVSSDSEFLTTYNKSTAVNFMGEPKLSSPSVQSGTDDQRAEQLLRQENSCEIKAPNNPIYPQNSINFTGCSSSNTENSEKLEQNAVNLHINARETKGKGGHIGKEKQNPIDWDRLRKEAQAWGRKGERTANTLDSVDWHAVRCAEVDEVAHTIRERGMNHKLAARIKDFLDRLVRDHGSLDLEWLRDVPPDKAKEYLLSVRGLGLKSVECVRLLTLHHLAFPVDTNVGRIAVRLGWVPLQPLPESLQLHLLELYPMLESIQKYLWPRLCKLDQRTLYELHYQMITFGKVFCTKNKPNCNACPMRGECRHFASAFASARLALPAPEEKSIVTTIENKQCYENPMKNITFLPLLGPQGNQMDAKSGFRDSEPIIEEPVTPEPTIEELDTTEPSNVQIAEYDTESPCYEDPDEIPTIQLDMEEFTQNVQKIMQQNSEIKDAESSKALVALTPEAALIPMPKLKNVSQLRTEHRVYELPDSHPLLEGLDKREPDDPCPYLLAIWTPGETMNSIEPPGKRCSYQESVKLCSDETCSSCNSIREANSLIVRGTLLIPCRTAMRGSFPLNGTYFQVNEVFSDHESSLQPIDIPRAMLWNLPRRTVFFGTSIPSIFKGLSTEGIQYCFWRGFVCVRGFDRKTRAPRPLVARLHFPASYLSKSKGKTGEN